MSSPNEIVEADLKKTQLDFSTIDEDVYGEYLTILSQIIETSASKRRDIKLDLQSIIEDKKHGNESSNSDRYKAVYQQLSYYIDEYHSPKWKGNALFKCDPLRTALMQFRATFIKEQKNIIQLPGDEMTFDFSIAWRSLYGAARQYQWGAVKATYGWIIAHLGRLSESELSQLQDLIEQPYLMNQCLDESTKAQWHQLICGRKLMILRHASDDRLMELRSNFEQLNKKYNFNFEQNFDWERVLNYLKVHRLMHNEVYRYQLSPQQLSYTFNRLLLIQYLGLDFNATSSDINRVFEQLYFFDLNNIAQHNLRSDDVRAYRKKLHTNQYNSDLEKLNFLRNEGYSFQGNKDIRDIFLHEYSMVLCMEFYNPSNQSELHLWHDDEYIGGCLQWYGLTWNDEGKIRHKYSGHFDPASLSSAVSNPKEDMIRELFNPSTNMSLLMALPPQKNRNLQYHRKEIIFTCFAKIDNELLLMLPGNDGIYFSQYEQFMLVMAKIRVSISDYDSHSLLEELESFWLYIANWDIQGGLTVEEKKQCTIGILSASKNSAESIISAIEKRNDLITAYKNDDLCEDTLNTRIETLGAELLSKQKPLTSIDIKRDPVLWALFELLEPLEIQFLPSVISYKAEPQNYTQGGHISELAQKVFSKIANSNTVSLDDLTIKLQQKLLSIYKMLALEALYECGDIEKSKHILLKGDQYLAFGELPAETLARLHDGVNVFDIMAPEKEEKKERMITQTQLLTQKKLSFLASVNDDRHDDEDDKKIDASLIGKM